MSGFGVRRSLPFLASAIVLIPILMSCSGDKATNPVKNDQPDKMIAEYTEAIRRKPDDANAYYKRGLRHEELGELNKAITDYTEAIQLKDPRAYANRAAVYQKQGKYREAITDYTAVIALNTKSGSDPGELLLRAGVAAKAFYSRGVCYDAGGEPDKAIADYKEAIRLEPGLLNDDLRRRLGK